VDAEKGVGILGVGQITARGEADEGVRTAGEDDLGAGAFEAGLEPERDVEHEVRLVRVISTINPNCAGIRAAVAGIDDEFSSGELGVGGREQEQHPTSNAQRPTSHWTPAVRKRDGVFEGRR
jgi:hypothetical protein